VQWTLPNILPMKNTGTGFDSRIVIKMPEKMGGASSSLGIKSLDGLISLPTIQLETQYPGCAAPRFCYSIKHSNTKDVPGGSTLRF